MHPVNRMARLWSQIKPVFLMFCRQERFFSVLAGLCLWLALSSSVNASSTIYGGGPFYAGGTAVMNTLRASGYTTVMLWTIHVDATTGNLIYNDQLVVSNGVYVGNSAWPAQLATLKVAPTSVNRIEWSVASAPSGGNDFANILTLMNAYGTNTTSILYRNFSALKTATGADAISYDDETQYDVATSVKFGRMLSSIGYKVTLCPYQNSSFWQSVYNQLGSGIVDRVYLQCYAGGNGNNPGTWNGYFSGLKVIPGMWGSASDSSGSTASQVETQMTTWRSAYGIPGGFMWLYDNIAANPGAGGSPADYAAAINRAVDPLAISPATGFSAVTAYNLYALPQSMAFALSNASASSLSWSLVNTSSWLSVSSPSGTLAAGAVAATTVSLNPAVATNLAFGNYTATVIFSNQTTGVGLFRNFTLNTAVKNWPVALTGFNAAILASNNATAGNPGATAFDIPNSYCFYQQGLSSGTRGLPLNGVVSSLSDTSTAFQLGPYRAADALMLGDTYPKSGTLTLLNPDAFNSLTILAASANGGGQGTFVLNFTNGTRSQVFAFNCQDWFYTVTNVAIQGFGRVKLGASFSFDDSSSANPNLYQTTLNLAALGLTQPIASITFSNRTGAGATETTAIFALSGMSSSVPVVAPTGLTAIPGTNATVKLSWNPSAGASSYNVKQSAVSGGSYATVGSVAGTSYTATGLANGSTYYYVVSAVGAVNESTNSVQASAMPGSYLGWAFAAQPVAYWPLNETVGTIAYDLVHGSNGVYAGGYLLLTGGATGAGFANPHRIVLYNGSTGYTQIPRLIGATNFSIVFWVRTGATGGGVNWYNGQGLVDGEVSGTTGDFGVALVGSKVGFGIGNPDTTLTSVANINNNVWHQVAVTRDAGSGAMTICIDGKLDSTLIGPIGVRTNSPALRIGSLQTGVNFFSGSISDVTLYQQILTTNQIATLYSAATGIFYNVTLTNRINGASLVLSWPGNGKLLEATNLAGPWTTNVSASPATVTPNQPQKFYRIRTQ